MSDHLFSLDYAKPVDRKDLIDRFPPHDALPPPDCDVSNCLFPLCTCEYPEDDAA